jgi:hypothetical protein
MIKHRFLIPMIFCYTLIIISCSDNKSQKNVSVDTPDVKISAKDSTIVSKKEEVLKPVEEKLDVKFIIKNKFSEDMPSSDISIFINGKTTFLANVSSGVEVQNDIGEKNSITACGGWWAGAGDYFYVAPSAKGVIVYKGWQDEEQEDSGYHWEKFKEISK